MTVKNVREAGPAKRTAPSICTGRLRGRRAEARTAATLAWASEEPWELSPACAPIIMACPGGDNPPTSSLSLPSGWTWRVFYQMSHCNNANTGVWYELWIQAGLSPNSSSAT